MARILCVDDEPNILTTVSAALRIKGHELYTANSEDGAIAGVLEHKPDLLILDVMMPKGSEGFHVVWRLRQLDEEALSGVPVIMATGIHEHTELRFYPMDIGGNWANDTFLPVQGWLDKPYSNDELYEAVDRVLAGESGVVPQRD